MGKGKPKGKPKGKGKPTVTIKQYGSKRGGIRL